MGTGSPQDWSEFDLQRVVGANYLRPMVTEDFRSICELDGLRVEQNRVRYAALDEAREVLRTLASDAASYEAVIVPELLDGRILLVSRYRYAIERWSIELPRLAGRSSDEGWKHDAESQLLSRYGLAAEKMSLLGAFYPDAAVHAVNTVVVLAQGCTQQSPPATDPRDLVAGSFAIGQPQVRALLERGEITCGVTLAALMLLGTREQQG